ncbi:MAG: carboxylate-amine ligase [Alphaproteobacteria bacterium]|nr:MAG: carboxylate-amine ligase [Alphaproteobacteria bacterium]
MSQEPAFTLGIEEEYHLVDRASGALAVAPPDLLDACQAKLAGQVMKEFLQSQIEVATRPCRSLAEARADLVRLRGAIIEECAARGLAPIAAATHPFAEWRNASPSEGARYQQLAEELQGAGRRLMICGMHVHVGIEDDELRIDLMNQLVYFLPHLLALATSSPFWRGEPTGLKSYRLTIFDGLPRTGLPEVFEGWSEYQRLVQRLVEPGLIEDASRLWWDIRPSARFPTLEMRIADATPRLADVLCLAALYRCLLRMLWRLKRQNQRWRLYSRHLIRENRWRAQRRGTEADLVDFGRGEKVPFAELLEELLHLTAPDAEALDCVAEVAHARTILADGTSADRQLRVYHAALAAGADRAEALRAVVQSLIEETAAL